MRGRTLLVIFGAGASHDSFASMQPGATHEKRPPLADELFETRFATFHDDGQIPEIRPLVPRLRHLGAQGSVEARLEGYQKQARRSDERKVQLLGIRYYLQAVINHVDRPWQNEVMHGASNYRTLIDDLRFFTTTRPRRRLAIVTFNYDRLLEWALQDLSVRFSSIDEYVSADGLKVFKVHGSVDWARDVDVALPSDFRGYNAGLAAMHQVIAAAPSMTYKNSIRLFPGVPTLGDGSSTSIPALAVPLQRKQDFELPEAHLGELRALLPTVDRVLMIGWRAADVPFLRLMGLVRPGAKGVVVANTRASSLVRKLRRWTSVSMEPIDGGFSQFVLDGETTAGLR